ncbi:G patch domain-containing protein 2 [Mortierella sp. GBA43]|nr:G patch domain-containing protein 2 [Mortierella sp. GBA43]
MFMKASSYDHPQDDADQGLDSDEIDEPKEEYLEQQFEWDEKDQDPDKKSQGSKTAESRSRQIESIIFPADMKWGGALAYNSSTQAQSPSSSRSSNPHKINDLTKHYSRMNVEDDEGEEAPESDSSSIEPVSPKTVDLTRRSSRMNTEDERTTTELSLRPKSKSSIPHSTTENDPDAVSVYVRSASIRKSITSARSVNMTIIQASQTIHDSVLVSKVETLSDVPQDADKDHEKPEEPLLWVLDTEPSAITHFDTNISGKDHMEPEEPSLWAIDTAPIPMHSEKPNMSYIQMPYEPQSFRPTAKKAKPTKRGGNRLREKKKKRRMNRIEGGDDCLVFEDDDDDKQDDDEEALRDYMENTVDDSLDERIESFVLSTLQGHHLDIGHSDGNLDSDSDTYFSDHRDDGSFPRTMSPDTDGPPPPRRVLAELQRLIEGFIQDKACPSAMKLPPEFERWRVCVREIANHYRIKVDCTRTPLLLERTNDTRLGDESPNFPRMIATSYYSRRQAPRSSGFTQTHLHYQKESMKSIEQGMRNLRGMRPETTLKRKRNKDTFDPVDPKKRKGPPGVVVTDGQVIGSGSAIASDNIGHRMLARMGWSPGTGLGASKDGITQPIEAVMKRSRRGIGHDPPKST